MSTPAPFIVRAEGNLSAIPLPPLHTCARQEFLHPRARYPTSPVVPQGTGKWLGEHVDMGVTVVARLGLTRTALSRFAPLALALVLFRAVTLARDLLQPFHRLQPSRWQSGRAGGDRVDRVDRSAHPHDTAGALTGSTGRRTMGGSTGVASAGGAASAAMSSSCSRRLISITTNRRHTNRAAAHVTT